jgi:secondary thiamine-phosphate synthase enzyme
MKHKTEYISLKTNSRREFVNITQQVRKTVDESGVKEGLCLVNSMHISSSIFINDNETGLHKDFDKWLEQLAPHSPVSQYRHNDTG